MEDYEINGLLYDIEIARCIPEKKSGFKKDPRFEYCSGWDDHRGMGIACIGCYDMVTQEARVFGKGNFGDFMDLAKERTEIISFNGLGFDDKVLAAHQMGNIRTTYDLFAEVKHAANTQRKWFYNEKRPGLGLNYLAADNGLPIKLMKGGEAPMAWQAAQYTRVIDYCLRDVMVLYRLFLLRHNLKCAAVADKTKNEEYGILKLNDPKSIREAVGRRNRQDW